MPNRYDRLMQRIRCGERILIDGATGTEIERRGVPKLENAWNGGGALSHPDVLREVHEDYIRHGAEIVISNTFATHFHALQDAGVEDAFEDYNRRGVELAIEARERLGKSGVLVGGGVSNWSWIGNHPSLEDLKPATERQAAIMAAAGADLLMLEMMIDIDRMLVSLEAAQASGLPVWVGLSCAPDDAGEMCLLNGEKLADALAVLADRDVDLVNIMHTEVDYIDACLEIVRAAWPGPVGVYAHTGGFVDGKWIYADMISPEDYSAAARGWLEQGVQVVGSCCGTGPRHIRMLAQVVEEKKRRLEQGNGVPGPLRPVTD